MSNGEYQTPLTRGEGHPVWREQCLGGGLGGAAEAGSCDIKDLHSTFGNTTPLLGKTTWGLATQLQHLEFG